LFSGSALGEANRQITEAKRQQSLMSAISDEAKDRRDIASYMSDINSRKYLNVGAGGYNQSSVRAAKEGATLEMFSDIIPICDTEINLISSDIELFKEGGQIEENKEYVPEDPDKIIKFVNKHKKVNFV
jgi:hypothetical protein